MLRTRSSIFSLSRTTSALRFLVASSSSSFTSTSKITQCIIIPSLLFPTTSRGFATETSAEDLFDDLSSTEPLVSSSSSSSFSLKNNNKRSENLDKYDNNDDFSLPSYSASFSISPSISTQLPSREKEQLDNLQNFLVDKIEKLSAVAAERRERGKRSPNLESKFGAGASKEWLEYSSSSSNSFSGGADSSSTSDNASLEQDYIRLLCENDENIKSASLQKREQLLALFQKHSVLEIRDLQQRHDVIDQLTSAAMKNLLLQARSPSEAREALELVAVATNAISSSPSPSSASSHHHSSSSSSSRLSSPLLRVWTTAVEAASLASVTPELFSRLLAEALPIVHERILILQQQKQQRNSSVQEKEKKQEEEEEEIRKTIERFQTSALSWCASQFELQIALRVWSSCILLSSSSLSPSSSSSPSSFSSSTSIMRQVALLIRSAGDFSSSSSSSPSPDLFSGDDGETTTNDITKLDGGVRKSVLSWMKKNPKLLSETDFSKLTWQNFQSLLSAFDSESAIRLMKLRMSQTQKNNNNLKQQEEEEEKEEQKESKEQNSSTNATDLKLLEELLRRFVDCADITSAEQTAQIIFSLCSSSSSSSSASSFSSSLLSKRKNNAVLLLMKLYSEKLAPADFDSCLEVFTKHCTFSSSSSSSSSCPPTSDHYSYLLRSADSSDAAAAIFLDACAHGIVLEPSAYRFLYQRESNTPLAMLRKQLPQDDNITSGGEAYSSLAAKFLDSKFDETVLPPLPVQLDAHHLLSSSSSSKQEKPPPARIV